METKRFAYKLLPLCVMIATGSAIAQPQNYQVQLDNQLTVIKDPGILQPVLCNPPLNSVRAAHGNTDWHIDTAHEFLYGVDMLGAPTATNHTPATWDREHIHVGMTNTSDYYDDDTVTTFGDDANADYGIDQTMLFFYAGHGNPTAFSTLGNQGHQSDMLLGNCGNGSKLRYYWQCSCEVFAHGPRDCGSGMEYSCPQDFDGSADSYNMRNVYDRWGPALDGKLRMACGSSTSAYCHEDQMNRIWYNYNVLGRDVADSFIFGLKGTGYDSGVVPLCITTGGWSTASTPLYDTTFTNAPNGGGDYYHIQYLASFDTTAPVFKLPDIPQYIARVKVILPDPPPVMRYEKMLPQAEYLISERTTASGRPSVRVDTRSNALYLTEDLDAKSAKADRQFSKEDYINRARSLLEEKGLSEPDMGEPEVVRVMIQSAPREGAGKPRVTQKSVQVTFPRVVGGIPVLGEGSKISLQLSNDGQLTRLSKVWRQGTIEPASKGGPLPVLPYDKAYAKALGQLGNARGYSLVRAEFGYKAEPGNVKQETVGAIYRFVFHAAGGQNDELPPRMVEIPAT